MGSDTRGTPPPQWYPDPATPGTLRYWDGTAWTQHTAPAGPAAPTAAMTPMTPTAPTGPRAWTRRTVLVLVACVALVVGGTVTAATASQNAATAHQREAEAALKGFLTAAVTGDDAWRDFATPRLVQSVPIGAPLGGEKQTAKALGLTVTYELGAIEYGTESPGALGFVPPADLAHAPIRLTYTFTAGGEKVTSTEIHQIWLSRPFYYGDTTPKRADRYEDPSAVGPWRVTGFTLPKERDELPFDGPLATTDLAVEYDEEIDGNTCYEAEVVLEQLSETARVEGKALSACYLDDAAAENGIDRAAFASSFAIVNSQIESTMPPELIRLDKPIGVIDQEPVLREYVISGKGGTYVVAIAGVSAPMPGKKEGLSDSTRIVSVQKIEGKS